MEGNFINELGGVSGWGNSESNAFERRSITFLEFRRLGYRAKEFEEVKRGSLVRLCRFRIIFFILLIIV